MKTRRQIWHRKNDVAHGRMMADVAGGFEKIRELRYSRRAFLKGTATSVGAAACASLFGATLAAPADDAVATGKFILPRLQFTVTDNTPDVWNISMQGDVNLRRKLKELTNINVSTEPKVVRLEDFDDMVRHPFVFMTSEGAFELPEKEAQNFREFLERGGFIMADDCVFRGKDRFFQAYLKLVNGLFPDNPMRKIPLDHEVFHIYYDFPKGAPHFQGVPHGAHGLFEPGTGRLMTILTPGDIHCAWCMRWWPGRDVEGIKFGINEIIYFLSH